MHVLTQLDFGFVPIEFRVAIQIKTNWRQIQ